MRILHCLRAPVGGLFRHVLDLAAEQSRRGHDVGILADSTGDRLTGPRLAAIAPSMRLGVTRIPIPREPGIGDLSAAHAVASHARRLDVDVLHGHGAKGGAYARLASAAMTFSASRPKVFYTPHGGSLNLESGAIAARAMLGVERQLERFTDGLIFESRFAADAYAKRVGEPRVPVRIIHNGLTPSDFEIAHAADDATDLLFIGELRDLKGVDVLIDAIADVNRDRAVTATIVGSGPDAGKLQARAAELGLGSRIRFTGALPARDAFRLGRIMVVPSLKESFPYVVLEAVSAGLPLVATSVGGIPEIVAGADTPLIEAGSRNALADAIRDVFADPELAAARSERLRMNIFNKCTVDGMAAAVVDFYARSGNVQIAAQYRPQPQR